MQIPPHLAMIVSHIKHRIVMLYYIYHLVRHKQQNSKGQVANNRKHMSIIVGDLSL